MICTYYDLLCVDKNSTFEDIKASYKALLLQYHPDKGGDTKDQFVEIQRAWDVLKDEKSRLKYDEELLKERLKERNHVFEEV